MKIYDYIQDNGLRKDYVAKRLGMSREWLWKINKTGTCSAHVAELIYTFTDGKVDYRSKPCHSKARAKEPISTQKSLR